MGNEIETHAGMLRPAQVNELRSQFANWDKWKTSYAGVADARETSLRYGTRTVTGSDLPREIQAICSRIQLLAQSLPEVNTQNPAENSN